MPRKKQITNEKDPNDNLKKRRAHSSTIEGRENEMIELAMVLAEQQLRDGTASSQLITEFVKRGSTKARLEKEILKEQKELMKAKTEALQSTKNIEELYAGAIKAMQKYSGHQEEEEEDNET